MRLYGRLDLDALYSVEEAARRLGGVSKWTVHAWLSHGKLQRTKIGGRTMIRESELERFIAQGDEKATEPRKDRHDHAL